MQATFMIDPKVQRSMYQLSIKRFLESNIQNYGDFLSSSNTNILSDLAYSKLLDKAIDQGLITREMVHKFLIDEMNYGLQRNIYFYFLKDTSALINEEYIIESIKKLGKFYDNCELVNSLPFMHNITLGTQRGRTELLYTDIIKNGNGDIESIRLIFSIGQFINGEEVNYYISIEINVPLKILAIKLRGINEKEAQRTINLNDIQFKFKNNILDQFELVTINTISKIRRTIYNITSDLTNRVLQPTIDLVNEKIVDVIDIELEKWNELILEDKIEITPADQDSLKSSILNNYYRLYMQNVVGKISNKELKDHYKVDGYVRAVKFEDDTIGEGKAKSPTKKLSLLDTSVYYDIKSRLDQSKTIKYSTVYWINVPGYKVAVGASLHAESGRFKCNIFPYFFNKEMFDYVLRKIAAYQG